ncbi:hypothetical protein DFR52_102382 [Hoeflea marina]|uniref:Uncharacterized protein n=1 Tax=Hoeflea marina TaxID=274592 RepID=A0A317PP15_9HYPH|nr:hypothetical protein DFR52_102382 [Hoeflea marina]
MPRKPYLKPSLTKHSLKLQTVTAATPPSQIKPV